MSQKRGHQALNQKNLFLKDLQIAQIRDRNKNFYWDTRSKRKVSAFLENNYGLSPVVIH